MWDVDVRRDGRIVEVHVDAGTGAISRVRDIGDDRRSDDRGGHHGADDGGGHDRFDDKGGDR